MSPKLEASRRAFLRAVGLGAASLPFFKLLENSAVNAQAAALPLRFIGLYHPHGTAKELWAPRANFDIGYANASLQPFDDAVTYGKSFKDKLLVIQGVDLSAGLEGGTTGHDAPRVILTGSAASGTNSSLDQFLALEQGLGAETRIASVVLGVGDRDNGLAHSISYATGGSPLPKIIDPAKTFDMLFSGLAAAQDPAAAAALARQRALGQSVIDYVRADINQLYPRLAPPEQAKLDQHLTSVRELEKRLSGLVNQCVVPGAPNSSTFPKIESYNGGEPYFDVITDLQIDLLAQAMACDLTRFATLLLADLSRTGLDPSLPDDIHNAVAHVYKGSRTGDATVPGDPASWAPLAKQNRYSYSKCARLLQKLDAFGILDSTLIYMSSDMGDPAAHSSRDVPSVLAGGANGKFRMGRFLPLAENCPANDYYCGSPTLVSNNKILVSICQAFGVDVGSFGTSTNPATVTGALSELV